MFFVLPNNDITPEHISIIFVNNEPKNKDKYDWIFIYNTAGNHYSALREKNGKYVLTGSEGNNIFENLKEKYIGGKIKYTRRKRLLLKNKTKKALKKRK